MDKLVIRGGRRLSGRVPVSGAKNAALPILAATLLAPGTHQLRRVPQLLDVSSMLSLLGRLGCPSLLHESKGLVEIDSSRLLFHEAPYDLVRKMRASVLVLGPLLARRGRARVSLPGGCAIGQRPIDEHLRGLEAMGCSFQLQGGYIEGQAARLRAAAIHLRVPSVTGTENLMMAASLAEGTSTLSNAACEPEIVNLADFLNSLGAKIHGAGTPVMTIEGVPELSPPEQPFSILADRIEAGTYLVAGAITAGDVTVDGARPQDLSTTMEILSAMGCQVTASSPDEEQSWIRVRREGALQPVRLSTAPYPGFPTDMQAQLTALASLASGPSTVQETIFENRFMHISELTRMGGRYRTDGNTVFIDGIQNFYGAQVMATDLRASASLVLAALSAEGVSSILRIYHLDRGYEFLDQKLKSLGAQLIRVDDQCSPSEALLQLD